MIITIKCTDQLGIIATVSTILKDNGCNIISMREHVAHDAPYFFCRVKTEPANEKVADLKRHFSEALPEDAVVTININKKKRIVVLVTKEYHCLGDILLRHQFGTLDAEVACVIGNYEALGDLCQRFDVPFHYVTHEDKDKSEFEAEIQAVIDQQVPDYIVLAKFMRILSSSFNQKYAGKIVNIHHSFLPAFIGANPYKKAFERGVKMIGATAHFVTDELDEGPIIAQEIISVNHTFDAVAMRNAGKEIEAAVLARALRLVLDDRVFVYKNKTVVFE